MKESGASKMRRSKAAWLMVRLNFKSPPFDGRVPSLFEVHSEAKTSGLFQNKRLQTKLSSQG